MTEKTLNHIAVIMDGNGRWATKRGLPRTAGHRKGAQTLMEICRGACRSGVKYLTLYAFSTENWNRGDEEVSALMGLLREYLDRNFREFRENGVRVRFIGERQMLDKDIVAKMESLEQETKQHTELFLQIALSYGSRQEIIHATRKLAERVQAGDIAPSEIDEKMFSDRLYTGGIPDPDLLIRTGGEQRISNYLLWQIAYAELFFTPTFWPDFTVGELNEIIESFKKRERRYGKI